MPYHDGIRGFWFKKFTSIHGRLALEMNRCLQDAQVPDRITKGKTTLIQKDPIKVTALNNYRPISCLPVMWKILTAQIRKKNHYSLTNRRRERMLQRTQRHIRITLPILNVSKTRRIDYKKPYDMVPQSLINSVTKCKKYQMKS